LGEPRLGERDVPQRCRLGLLLKDMQDKDGFRETRDINEAISGASIENSDLLDARANAGHRLEVVGLHSHVAVRPIFGSGPV